MTGTKTLADKFLEAVQSAIPDTASYKTQLGQALTGKLSSLTLNTELNDRNINAAAGAFVSGAKTALEQDANTDLGDLAQQAYEGLIARSNHKGLATNGKAEEAAKTAFTTALETKSDIVKAMEGSFDKNQGGMGMAVRYGTAAVGAFLVYNRLKAMFKTKEVENEQGEVVQKKPSFLSRLGNLLLATGIGVVTYKVGVQNKTYGQVGEDMSNFWQKYVSNRGKTPGLMSFPSP